MGVSDRLGLVTHCVCVCMQMLHYLTSPTVVAFDVMDQGWTVKSLLHYIGNSSFHALIDTGALITGMDNLQVGQSATTDTGHQLSSASPWGGGGSWRGGRG